MNIRQFLSVLFLIGCLSPVFSQQTAVYTDANGVYKRGVDFFEKGLYAAANAEFTKVLRANVPTQEPKFRDLQMKAELYIAKTSVRQKHPDGEKLMLDFIRNHSPEPIASQAILEAANYYYNDKRFEKALEFLEMVNTFDLSETQRSEVLFKKGYVYFVNKKFKEAKAALGQTKEIRNEYYDPSNYYYGMTAFFDGDYDSATQSFQKVATSTLYKPHVPFYLTQIYFAQGDYDKVISYATPLVNEPKLKKRKELHQLIGQAYFEKQQYTEALPYLEFYAESTSSMREEEFYQLAFAQYKTGHYKEAADNFEQLGGVDNEMAQNALYNLGDSYIRLDKKEEAREAFGAASRMDYDKVVTEEALFNFGKLSYELGADRDAVTAFQSMPTSSKYYNESQRLLSEVFLNTRDYARAIKIIEGMPSLTPQMKETYQKVTYYRGTQLFADGKQGAAKRLFEKSLEIPADVKFKALSHFWLGEIAHGEKQYNESVQQHNQFLTLSKGMRDLPEETAPYLSNYTQGYNYLKQKNYGSAVGYFQDAVAGIKQNAGFIKSDVIKNQILPDAVLRAGDGLFKRNQYNDAIKFYNEAVNRRYKGFVYALYQKAIIEGLRGNTVDKIVALEDIIEKYPNSEYTDEALLQLGITYQELGKLTEATVPLKKLVKDFKGKSNNLNSALIRLGLITYNQGSPETALDYYKKVFDNNPTAKESEDALAAIKEIYVDDLGRTDDYFAFLRSINLDVDESQKEDVAFKAAESQFENANYERAIEGFNRYLSQYANGRNNLVAHYHRGESHSVLKQYSLALRDYEYVVGKGQSKHYLKALEKAAIIAYNHEQDFGKSYNLFVLLEQSAESDDQRFEAQIGALRSAYRAGNSDAVYSLASKVVNNNRASQEQVAAANFYLGKVAYDRKDYDNALSAFSQVKRLSDNELTAEARYLEANITFLKRDLENAVVLLKAASRASSSYPYWVANGIVLLADVYTEQDDLFRAKTTLEALLANYNDDQEIVNRAKRKLEQVKAKESATNRLTKPNKVKNSLIELDETGNN